MPLVVTTVDGVKTEHELPDKPGGFTCIVHQQGMKVDVPTYVEVNPKNTIACMADMNQKQWEWISTGPLFTTLFNLVFDQKQETHFQNCKIPKTIEELNDGDMGVAHMAGLIILSCEAFFAGRSVFMRNPECYLHPATERNIMTMIEKMMQLCGVRGKVEVAVDDPPDTAMEKMASIANVGKQQKVADPEEKPNAKVVRWLKSMDVEKKFAQCGDQIYTVADMILEVTNDTPIGKQLIEQFLKSDFKIKPKA
jgi:hypothetical protein